MYVYNEILEVLCPFYMFRTYLPKLVDIGCTKHRKLVEIV